MARTAARVIAASAVTLVVSQLPALAKRPRRVPSGIEGVSTLQDAVRVCRHTGLQGWELVEYARQVVRRKFVFYSTRNLWDTPARAFERGMGYCTQYNLSLKHVLQELDFHTEALSSARVRVAADPTWRMGHTWVRVVLNGETRDVCAHHGIGPPGKAGFVAVAPVWHSAGPVLALAQLGMIPFCGVVEWAALLRGRGEPGWTFHLMDEGPPPRRPGPAGGRLGP